LRFSFIAAPPGVYNLAAGTAHQEVFYFSRAIHKIGYTIARDVIGYSTAIMILSFLVFALPLLFLNA